MVTAAVVPAKGTSIRIPNKNTQIIDGEYLFKRKLIQLLDCSEIDEVWLDSDNENIHSLASDLPIKHLYREQNLSDNSSDGHDIFSNASKHIKCDILVQALCTSPFIEKDTIDPAILALKSSSKSSLVAVSEQKIYEWENNKPKYGFDKIPNSVDLITRQIESMGLYIVKTNNQQVHKRFTEDVLLYTIDPHLTIDINNMHDLAFCKTICSGHRNKTVNKFKILSKSISSCLISDICKSYNIPHFLGKNIRPLCKGSFMGFAKTLKLRALTEEEKKDKNKWKDIFKAVNSYDFIESGDVIVVQNDLKNKAYFGDLNAHFAYKNGAVGVVIDGLTRDIERVSSLGLPVYAHGNQPDDIRYEGTLEAINQPITINNICIKNNDIIFADLDGVVCVSRNKLDLIYSELKNNLKTEMIVKLEAIFDSKPQDILDNIGLF
jgi:regulator of RNase E activity RraA/CMP-N-acetylneuraminic acid synthetase